jgi:hypothetical protein
MFMLSTSLCFFGESKRGQEDPTLHPLYALEQVACTIEQMRMFSGRVLRGEVIQGVKGNPGK